MFIEKRTTTQNYSNSYLRIVDREFVKNTKIPGFEYQTVPYMERSLMPSKYSVLRIIPGVGPDGRILSTYKDGADLSQAAKDPSAVLSDTFCCVTSIQPFGNNWSDTVLAAYPAGSPEEEQRVNMNMQSVLEKFTRVVSAATDPKKKRSPIAPHEDWFRWTQFKGGTLGKVKYRLLMQAILWVDSDKPVEIVNADGQREQKPIIALVSIDQNASMKEFLTAVAEPMNVRQLPDPFTNSNLGPVAELNGIWCYMHPEKNTSAGEQDVKNFLIPRPYAMGGSMSDPASEYALEEEWVRNTWVPWDKLLKKYTMEEQYHLIAQTFGPDTVNYVFESLGEEYYTSFIPVDIRQKGFGRYQSLQQGGRRASVTPGTYGAVQPSIPPVNRNPVVAPSIPLPTRAPAAPSAMPVPSVPDMTSDDSIPMDFVPKSANPKVQELMKEALIAGVQVTSTPNVPKLPKLPPIPGGVASVPVVDLDSIQATSED